MSQNAKITSFFGKPAVQLVPTRAKLPNDAPKGLIVIDNYISSSAHDELLSLINKQEWSNLLKRRVQHYGYEYSYQQRTASKRAAEMPGFAKDIAQRLVSETFFAKLPDQLIINEYTPGQGIAAHTDARVFGDTIVSLSLGSACSFVFTRLDSADSPETFELYLRPGTLVVMTGESRYNWNHSITPRKTDIDPDTGRTVLRGTRVSLTFREMKK